MRRRREKEEAFVVTDVEPPEDGDGGDVVHRNNREGRFLDKEEEKGSRRSSSRFIPDFLTCGCADPNNCQCPDDGGGCMNGFCFCSQNGRLEYEQRRCHPAYDNSNSKEREHKKEGHFL